MCISLTILEDTTLESEERLLVLMEADDPRVEINGENSLISVFIFDNDGGLFL